ncbi:MAG TPA: potassium/proton antiporter [Gaiellales bacterium]|nr:potassium/proton antiporter [Gaiellales bacterium]
MHHDALLILVAGVLLATGVAASLAAARVRLPALVVFVVIGMAIGTDGLGWIAFDDYELARSIGTVALVLILFEGGVATGLSEIRPVLRSAIVLAVGGTIVTALVTGFAAAWLFDLSSKEGLLLGAILSATDGAAVFALMRGSHLPARLARTLEAEAGLNDPVAVLLVVALVELIQTPGYGAIDGAVFFVRELAIGAAVGVMMAAGSAAVMRRLGGAPSGLLLVSSASTAAVGYGAAAAVGGSGFLAVYVAGLVLSDREVPARDAIRAFHSGLASVAEIGMFLAFGLLVFPSQLGDVLVEGTLLGLVVAFVARPLATALAMAFEPFTRAERAVIGWAGLRGAVPVILATFPVIDGVPHSLEFFNIAFFAVLVSTVVQGSTVELLAARLGLAGPSAHAEAVG